MKKDCLLSNLKIKKKIQTPKKTKPNQPHKNSQTKTLTEKKNPKPHQKTPSKNQDWHPGKGNKHLPRAQGKVNHLLKEDDEFRESYLSFTMILLR